MSRHQGVGAECMVLLMEMAELYELSPALYDDFRRRLDKAAASSARRITDEFVPLRVPKK